MCDESCELMHQDVFYVIRLLYLNAHPHTIHRRLYEDFLILISGYVEGIEEDFGAASGFDFGDIVPLGCLRGEV